jgi:hypothetical protein
MELVELLRRYKGSTVTLEFTDGEVIDGHPAYRRRCDAQLCQQGQDVGPRPLAQYQRCRHRAAELMQLRATHQSPIK